MNRVSTLVFGLVLATAAAGQPGADAQPNSPAQMASNAAATLSPVDYNFVAQANLGAPFQINSGRIAEEKATSADIRDYAHLMVVSHIPVVDGLNSILQWKQIVGSEVIKRAADEEVRHSLAVWTDVKIGGVQPQKIITTRPQDKAYRVDDGGLAGVVWPDKNVQAAPQVKRKRSLLAEASESCRKQF
jgi:hypothetical protein